MGFFLPGVPREMKTLFGELVLPELEGFVRESIHQVRLRTFGMTESGVNDRLAGIEAAHGVTLAYRAHFPEIEVKVLARAEAADHAASKARAAADEVISRLGPDVVYGEGDVGFAEMLGRLLVERKLTLAVAESCTGGTVARLLTERAGSSDFFLGGAVTYANSAKQEISGRTTGHVGSVRRGERRGLPCHGRGGPRALRFEHRARHHRHRRARRRHAGQTRGHGALRGRDGGRHQRSANGLSGLADPGAGHRRVRRAGAGAQGRAARTRGGMSESSPSGSLRAFFALPVRDADKAPILDAQRRLRRALETSRLEPRFIVAEQLHITLKFLGQVSPERVPALAAIGARRAAEHAPFTPSLSHVTAFGSPRRARVIVVGFDEPDASLEKLAADIESDVEPLGIPRETRPFVPHVSLARLKRPGDASAALESAKLAPSPAHFDELRLYRSELTPAGGVYSVLGSWPLSGSPT